MHEKIFNQLMESWGKPQAELARRIGVNPMTVTQWKSRGIPAERVLEVEALTGVSRHKLRPDIYPCDGKYEAA